MMKEVVVMIHYLENNELQQIIKVKIPHHKTYLVAKKIKSYKFHREHIEGGVKSISQKLIGGYKSFNCPEDVLKWLKDNYFVVLRLDTEKEKINQQSKLTAIKSQII